ncbi:uncharacterized protein TEOVI_000654100 [Trypanosoma equiperdum]|uniref:Uncharacterized protein n=1 Tax=Trypanosoma equiperdum TaxID=5694 RepID=A0A1G4HZP9_TRYEQ|nr:hypothetical protein, conserved [Trypanosoma equiperdum]
MLRRSYSRLGHQLIKEPLGHEQTTFARGQRTMANTLKGFYALCAFSAVGCVFASYSLVTGMNRVYPCVNSKGTLSKDNSPFLWWRY